MNLYTIYNFKNNFTFCNDCIGKKIEITIKNKPVTIFFPNISSNVQELLKDNSMYFSKCIIQPDIDIENLNPDLDWGHLISYPNIEIEINQILIMFSENDKDIILNNINDYFITFFDYLKIISKKVFDFSYKSSTSYNQLFYLKNKKLYKTNDTTIIEEPSIVFDPESNNGINFDILVKALNYASNIDIALEYKLLLNSYSSFENNDFRSAIIEATSSLEISLSNKILSTLTSINFPEPNKLLKKYKMAGGKFELATILHILLPTQDYKEKILTPRNKVIHNGIFIDKETTLTAIKEVEKYLDAFSPLI